MEIEEKEKILSKYRKYLSTPDQLVEFFSSINHSHLNEGNCIEVTYHPNLKLGSFEISNFSFEVDENGKLTNFPRPIATNSIKMNFLTSTQLRQLANLLNSAANDIDVLNDVL